LNYSNSSFLAREGDTRNAETILARAFAVMARNAWSMASSSASRVLAHALSLAVLSGLVNASRVAERSGE
jgi:hypothetical protein